MAFIEGVANLGKVVCYEYIGQHGEASLGFVVECRDATEGERAFTLKALTVIYGDTRYDVGYDLEVVSIAEFLERVS